MIQNIILLLIIFIVSLIMAIAFGFLNYKYKHRLIDYYIMFLIGVGWTILGLLFLIPAIIVFGGSFAIIGYLKRRDWDEDLTGIGKANKDELILLREQTDSLELSFTLLIFTGIIILIGIIIYVYLTGFSFLK